MKFLDRVKKKTKYMMGNPLFRKQAKEMASIENLINEIMVFARRQNKSSMEPITKEKLILHARSISEGSSYTLKQTLQKILWSAQQGASVDLR